MDAYVILKFLHVIGAAVLLGTGKQTVRSDSYSLCTAAYGGSALFRGLAALPLLPLLPNTGDDFRDNCHGQNGGGSALGDAATEGGALGHYGRAGHALADAIPASGAKADTTVRSRTNNVRLKCISNPNTGRD
jgi:hypothetical protein